MRTWRTGALLLTLLVLPLTPCAAETLVRGPYLQRVAPDSVVVRWSTAEESVATVEYGTSPEDLARVAAGDAPGRDHAVELTGLEAGRRHHYAVGDANGRLANGAGSFATPPATGSAAPFRVWVTGDVGTGGLEPRRVRDAFFAWAGDRGADLWLMLGDNAYNDGTEAEYQRGVFAVYGDQLRSLPLFPTLGNHDGHSASSAAETGPYYDLFTLPAGGESGGVPSGTEAYYSFDYGNAHFVCLESYSLDRRPGSPMLEWLAADLAATTQRWIVVYFHHPPYTRGSHDSDRELQLREMRAWVMPVLEAHGVDLVLAGHSHSYERSYLVDGHYGHSSTFSPSHLVDGGDGRPAGDGPYRKGLGAHRGTVYVVAGSSARLGGGRLNHPVMAVATNRLGSVALDFAGRRLDAYFVDDLGVVRDHFAIVKGAVDLKLPEPPPKLKVITGEG
ncbi:MAG TPA: metallophosphoesterase family protein [Thermoanaerobaculia bacterium]|nr:metallophosphoesterase family protein [Thermoanaerobaculia bacterium]